MKKIQFYTLTDCLLNSDGPVTALELGKAAGISSKSVFRASREWQQMLAENGMILNAHKGRGFSISIIDRELFAGYGHRHLYSTLEEPEFDDHDSLVRSFLFQLFTAEEPLLLQDLADQNFLSEKKTKTVMQAVRSRLNDFGLSLSSRPYKGTSVSGSELNIRLCFVSAFPLPYLEKHMEADCALVSHESKEVIRSLLGKGITDDRYYDTLKYFIISCRRIRAHCIITEEEASGIFSETDSECKNEKLLFLHAGIAAPQNEISILHIFIMSMRDDRSSMPVKTNEKIGQEIVECLRETDAHFNESFSEDEELIRGLTLHMIPMQHRIRLNNRLVNPYLNAIHIENRHAYEIADYFLTCFSNLENLDIPDDETGFIALHFQYALLRKNTHSCVPVLVCCPHSRGIAMMLRQTVCSGLNLPDERVNTISLYDLKTQMPQADTILITTDVIPFEIDARVIHVSYPLTLKQKERIQTAIFDLSTHANRK